MRHLRCRVRRDKAGKQGGGDRKGKERKPEEADATGEPPGGVTGVKGVGGRRPASKSRCEFNEEINEEQAWRNQDVLGFHKPRHGNQTRLRRRRATCRALQREHDNLSRKDQKAIGSKEEI